MLVSVSAAKIWWQYSGQMCFLNAMLWKRFFKTFVWGLSWAFSKQWKKKFFATCEIQYFEFGIFSFYVYVYYPSHGFITSNRAFNLLSRAFNLPTRTFNHTTRAFSLLTRGFELVTREFELVTRGFELVTCGFELVTHNSWLVFYFSIF